MSVIVPAIVIVAAVLLSIMLAQSVRDHNNALRSSRAN